MPTLIRGMRIETVGYSNDFPGGYSERMILNDALLLPVPNGLSAEHAALTEPMAVGLHAVVKANLGAGDAPLVVGCGPVGLAVIAALKLRGVGPIIAADFSPMRRKLAERLGADHLIDPRAGSAYAELARVAAGRSAVIFECVGVPGMLQEILRGAPIGARVVVAGVCMEDDLIRPMLAISKEIALQFVLGYLPNEFADTLDRDRGRQDRRRAADHRPRRARPRAVGVRGARQARRARQDPGGTRARMSERLRQLAPDLWVAEHSFKNGPFEVGTRMTVIRLRDGGLFLHSPVAPRPPAARRARRARPGARGGRAESPPPPVRVRLPDRLSRRAAVRRAGSAREAART